MEYKAKVGKIQGNAILSSAPILDDRLKRNNIALFDILCRPCAKKENHRASRVHTEGTENFLKNSVPFVPSLGASWLFS
jgi:hypothetical protein